MLTPRPVPLFRDPALATSPPLTAEAVAEAERALGVRLPGALVDALRAVNGGKLRRSLLPLADGPFAPGVTIPYLLGIGGPGGLPALQALAARWRYPVPGGVLLASAGPRALLLDPAVGPEPAVAWVDMQRPAGAQVARVARDAAELLARLIDGSPSWTWAIPASLTLQDAAARLKAGDWDEVERHYGIHRFRKDGAELRLEPNQERDGGGLHAAELADCPLVARLVEAPAGDATADAVDGLLAPDGVRVHTPHPAVRPR